MSHTFFEKNDNFLVEDTRTVDQFTVEIAFADDTTQLAWELETVKTPFDVKTLNSKRQVVIRYAIAKRKKYRLTPGARHAIVVE